MGLDMYMFRIKKYGLPFNETLKVNELIVNEEQDKMRGFVPKDILAEIEQDIMTAGTCVHWNTLAAKVAYWRKANAIHKWFVDNCQNGVDDCASYNVTKEQLIDLQKLCQQALKDKPNAGKYLPTQSGFFFGNISYDDWYFKDLEATDEMIAEIINETDFNEQYVYYSSSW